MLKTDVDYGYYVSSFSVGTQQKLSALEFYTCLKPAKAFLESVLCCEEPVEAEKCVKDCLCCLAEEICRQGARRGIKSENTDGYSVTFCQEDNGRNLLKIVNIYLGNSGLVFAGVDV